MWPQVFLLSSAPLPSQVDVLFLSAETVIVPPFQLHGELIQMRKKIIKYTK